MNQFEKEFVLALGETMLFLLERFEDSNEDQYYGMKALELKNQLIDLNAIIQHKGS